MRDSLAEVSDALQGRYTIERELGRGGMAAVYLAHDSLLGRWIALKLLQSDLGATLGPERFQREIAIASRLDHPHILAVHDAGQAKGRLFYVMPYVEGESLRQRLEREPQLPVAEVIRIVQAVASALDHAHRAGVVHRDIKPENILLAQDPQGGPPIPLVTDFGIAKALDGVAERLTETGLALGTPAYMSPEQAAGGGRLDGRSDVYALGCLAYEMLAGAPPFTGLTAQAVLARHAVDPVPPLRTVRPGVPAGMAAAIERALAKVPADRFDSAGEFAEALVAERPELPGRYRTLVPPNTRLLLMACVALAAVTTFALWGLQRGPAPPVVTSAATIAVLPLFPATEDTALVRLGRDLAVTISASLDGVGGVETADRLSMATETAELQSLSAAEAASVARRLGARSMLRGTLVRAGDMVRLDLGLYTTEGLAPLAVGISVTAHHDSIGALTDSAAWSLLRQVWKRGPPPSPSLAAVTTRSLPALRAFLEGERELGANRWDKAALAFRSAIADDSTFGLAHFRYALAQYWLEQPVEQEVLDALRRHRDSFPQRERLLTDAFLTPAGKAMVERYREVTQQFPDYWPGWFLYADALGHIGTAAGFDWSEGFEAYQRVVNLNPDLIPAWEHMFFFTLRRRPEEAARALARLAELGWPSRGGLGNRLGLGIARGGGRITPELDMLADSFVQRNAGKENLVGPLLTLSVGFPEAQLDLNHRFLRTGKPSRRMVTALRASNAWSWATRGRWDSALARMDEVVSSSPGPVGPDTEGAPVGRPVLGIESYAMAVLGAWLGAIAPALAEQRRAAAIASIGQLDDEGDRQDAFARLAWFDGILGFAGGERSAIASARREALRTGYYQANLVDRSLAAFDRALAGDRKQAGRELAALEEDCLNKMNECNSFTPQRAVHRLAAVEWLREAKEANQSRRLLQVWSGAGGAGATAWWSTPYDAALSGPAYYARGRLEEAQGRPSVAREYYQLFLRTYDQPMPSHAHLVKEAKAGLGRLEPDR